MTHKFETSADGNELMVMEIMQQIFFDDELYNLTSSAKHRINHWIESKLLEIPSSATGADS